VTSQKSHHADYSLRLNSGCATLTCDGTRMGEPAFRLVRGALYSASSAP